mgnify:CR=1 FL=1
MTDNREYCKRIADEIEAYAAGRMWKCPECGEIITTEDNDAEAPQHCDTEAEALFIGDCLEDALDYEFTVNSSREYKSTKIWVALGGPNVWVDTAEHAVKLAWGVDREEYPLSYDASDAIDDYMSEIYGEG